MKSVCIIGSSNYDLVTGVDVVPDGGETVPANSFATHHGGKGANQAYALRRLTDSANTKVAMVGSVGNDTFGHQMIEHLQKSGVDTTRIKHSKFERTGTATISVEKSGENRIMVYPGANGTVTEEAAIDAVRESNPDFVVSQNEIPLDTTMAVLRHVEKSSTIQSVFNPSPLPKSPISEWPEINLSCVNGGEAAALSGLKVDTREDAEKACGESSKSCKLCVITLGGDGVVWQAKEGKYKADKPDFEPAHKVEKIVDTTGAGDTFLAALVSRLSMFEDKEEPLRSHIAFAQAAAAIAVTRPGAASSIPSLEEVKI